MNKQYVIRWKSKVNGRNGKGTTTFTQAEADKLVTELNRDYPEIEHEAVLADPTAAIILAES